MFVAMLGRCRNSAQLLSTQHLQRHGSFQFLFVRRMSSIIQQFQHVQGWDSGLYVDIPDSDKAPWARLDSLRGR